MSRLKKLIRTLIALLVLASSLFAISLAIWVDYDPVAIAVAFQDDNKRDQALETIDFSLEYGHGSAEELKKLKEERSKKIN